jgi:hypothetical protein
MPSSKHASDEANLVHARPVYLPATISVKQKGDHE